MADALLIDLIRTCKSSDVEGAESAAAMRAEAELTLARLNADLERRVAQRTRTLEKHVDGLAAKNLELEEFSVSVAHDLRSPVRAIDDFGRMLAEDPAGRLDEQQRGYLRRILAACGHMDSLISAILTLFRLSRQVMQREPLDLAALARKAACDLQMQDPNRQVEFEIPEAMPVVGDPSLLQAVIDNLFANAWKFTRNRSCATITLGALKGDQEIVCFVRDDGVGFSTSRSDLLFAPFGRLHTEKEFDGIGLGLATVERIIERHGGRVWAHGVVDQEATFYFSLPLGGGTHA